jgi:hypothetical protein
MHNLNQLQLKYEKVDGRGGTSLSLERERTCKVELRSHMHDHTIGAY